MRSTSATRPAAAKSPATSAATAPKRVAKAVLIGAVPPLMLKTAANPGGLPMEVFDGIRAGVLADRSQFFKDLTMPFYGFNRPGAKVSKGVRELVLAAGDDGRLQGRRTIASRRSRRPTSPKICKKIDVPTLIMHGDDDQIVPIGASAMLSSKLVKGATLKVYPGVAARHVLDPQGPDQRGPARVHQGLDGEGGIFRNRWE